ncbi:MAG: TIM barrel protein [Candidatus Aenigmarchaeota archaeon]|nr:TIM barrel protein [Candidatus Aenigmarchaeota archaeon]
MTKIWLGPAGIPLTAKDRTTIGGLKRVAELKLNALEIEFVRKVYLDKKSAEEVGKIAKELGIKLSTHAPYFLNICSGKKQTVEATKRFILDSMDRAQAMGADVVVAHIAYYSGLEKKKAFEVVKREVENILDEARTHGIENVFLGLETTGKVSQFGTVEEIVNLCKKVKGCTIVLDPAHIYARNAGKIDYGEMLDKVEQLKLKHLHMHFSGIKWNPVKATGFGNEREHMPINNSPPFEPLAKEILKRKLNVTIISESPVLEKDALKMKTIFEKLGYKF